MRFQVGDILVLQRYDTVNNHFRVYTEKVGTIVDILDKPGVGESYLIKWPEELREMPVGHYDCLPEQMS